MTDSSQHPGDAALFDLVEGVLHATARAEVERHLGHCPACASLVAAVRAGRAAAAGAERSMASERVEQLLDAVAEAWQAEHADVPAPAPSMPPRRSRPRRSWSRRLVPVLGFAVLAALTGTSIFLGDERPGAARDAAESVSGDEGRSRSKAGEPESTDEGDGDVVTGTASDTAVSESDSSFGAPPPGGEARDDGAATGASASDATREAAAGSEEVCIATTDEAALTLPDGRVPRSIVTGPLGIFVVCG